MPFPGVCRETLYSLARECVVSHHLIKPRLDHRRFHSLPVQWQGPKIQIDLNRHSDGVFLDSNKILKSEVQI